MVKIHDFAALRAKRARAGKAIPLTAIGAAAVIIIGAVSFASLGEFSTAVKANTRTTTPANVSDAASNAGRELGFDYFPSHYVNQATEPAEPIATF